jgi:hypothetical protein
MFEFGIDSKYSKFASNIGSARSVNANVQYLAMKFQINNKIATSIGLTPFSDIGYVMPVENEIENVGRVLTKYSGSGTVSNVYIGIAVEPFKNVSIGANLNYLFGKLNKNAEVYFLDSPDFYSVQKYANFRIRDFGLDFGVQVKLPLKNKKHIIFAAVLENKPEYTSLFSDLTKKSITYNKKTDQDPLHESEEELGKIKMPFTIGGGVSFVKEDALEINIDYFHQSWSKSTFFGEKPINITDLNKFAAGVEWIPNKFSIRSYTSKIAFRAGFKYEETYLLLGNHQINDFGISFGVGLPVYRSNSTVNIAAEFGRRGTKKNGLILESYARLNLSLNLYDLWFIKRRFD